MTSDRGRAGQRRPPTGQVGSESMARVAEQVDRLCWTGILLGLAFTMTNVQQFAASGARAWSLLWCAAWLLDPMVSLVLLAILRAEQATARYGVRMGGWVRTAKWFTLAATYVMNTWSSFTAGSPSSVVLHSVPPLVVFVAAEAVTDLREKLGVAVAAASMNATPAPATGGTGERAPGTARRTSFAEYLAVARRARTVDVVVTPAWVRTVTGCSRGLSPRLAAALVAESEAGS
jgi:hypothetical protein